MSPIKSIYKSLVIQILFLVLLLASCSGDERGSQVSKIVPSIESIIEQGKKAENSMKFSLLSLSVLEWDKLYFFGPYTPTIDIEKKIGAINSAVKEINIEVRDDINLLIFMEKNTIVAAVPYPRHKADFSRITSGTGVLKKESFFVITESTGEQKWLYIELAR